MSPTTCDGPNPLIPADTAGLCSCRNSIFFSCATVLTPLGAFQKRNVLPLKFYYSDVVDPTLTIGSLSPPTSNLTAPSLSASVRTVLLSLSATYRQLQGSSGARARPEG